VTRLFPSRLLIVLALVVADVTFALTPVGAHVVVFPHDLLTTAPACGTITFAVRVPTEKPIPTTAVRLRIPPTITVIAVQAKPGWRADFLTNKGRITAITWSGGKIMPREFDEFAFLAAVPKTAGTVSWDAEQTYADGSVVAWTGAPGSETPHSQTTFTSAPRRCRS